MGDGAGCCRWSNDGVVDAGRGCAMYMGGRGDVVGAVKSRGWAGVLWLCVWCRVWVVGGWMAMGC